MRRGFAIRHSRPEDARPIAALMSRAFAPSDPLDLSEAWWRWKYLGNPSGSHSLVCERQDGSIIGHYGGVPTPVWSEGSWYRFGQNCDSCTDPDVRRGLRNPGTFVSLALAYASSFAGPDQDAVMYGLPIREAFRIGSRYLDYWLLRQQPALLLDHSIQPYIGSLEVSEIRSVRPDCDAFLGSVVQSHRCHAERSARFLEWRFLNSPRQIYSIACARESESGQHRGVAIYRHAEIFGSPSGILMDLLCRPYDDEAARSLTSWAINRAAQDRQSALLYLTNPGSWIFEFLQGLGFEVIPTPYMAVARTYHPDLSPAYLREHWTYSLADYDIL